MTWLYIPNIEPSPSAPELEASSLASSSLDPERAASLTWRGKHMQPAHWSRAWKRDSWLRRLSGLTLPPSTRDRFADAFIASLPEIRARRTALLENGWDQPARASSPPRSFVSPTSAGLIVSSERTSRGMRTDSLRRSSQHWSDWATALRLEYSARPVSEEATAESACSSWPTATVGDSKSACNATAGRLDPDSEHHSGTTLIDAIRTWSTPRASDGEKGGPNMSFGAGGIPLPAQAAQWMTPNVPNGGRSATHAEVTGRTAMHNGKKVQIGLEHQARGWATPCARDWRGSGPETVRKDGKSRMDMLDYQAERGFQSLHRAQPIDAGPTSSPERRTLNPLFVEWLMGWPIGWTDCGCAEMEFIRWQQDMRGLLSTLCSRTPRQATLL